MSLRIQLLGPFRVWRDDEEITAAVHKIGKADTFVKLLISQPSQTFTPDQLVEALWGQELEEGKTTVEKATANLHRRISELRKLLEPSLKKSAESQYILRTPKGYCFNQKAPSRIDAEEFAQRYESAQRLQIQQELEPAVAAYEAMLALVQGEYLAEDRYAEWAVQPRQKWQETYLETLANLAECHARLGQYRRAIARCHQALRSQEHRESIHRQLMLYCYLAGDQAEALKAYESCRETLAKHLDVEPSPETKDLHKQILNRNIPGVDHVYKPANVERHPIPYSLGKTPFVGRTKEYSVLMSHLQESQASQGRALFICGEAGIGKTRLVQELLAYARERDARILQGRCSDLATKLAFEPIIQALRNGFAQISERLKSSLAPLWLSEIAKLVPECFALQELPANPALSPEQERHRLFEALTQLLIILGQEKFLVLFLDDLHWADSATSDFLHYSAPRIAAYPIIIWGTYRSEEVSKPPLAPLRDETGREIIHCVQLTRLSVAETEKLLQEMGKMPEAVAERLGRRLHQETEGNPFFLVAVLQALFEEGAMQVNEHNVWMTDIDEITANYRELLIPTKIKEVIQRRLNRLSEEEQELLTLAAVAGRRFDYSLLEKAWNKPTALDVVEKLAKAQLLIAENGHYEFNHDKVREVIYSETSAPRREKLHRQVGETMEQLYSARLGEYYNALAHHFSQSRELRKALDYTLLALQQAVARYQNEEGLKLTELGLKLYQELTAQQPPDPPLIPKKSEILTQRVGLYDILGRRAEQAQAIAEVFQWAEFLKDETLLCEAHLLQSRLALALGKYSEAQSTTEQALGLTRHLGDRQREGRALQTLGTVHWYLGKHTQALECYTQAAQLAEAMGAAKEHMNAVHNIGIVHHQLGQYSEALECYRKAGELARQTGDKLVDAQSLKNIGAIQDYRGDYRAALETYEKASELFHQIGAIRGQANTLSSLGILYLNLERYDKALSHYEWAYELCKNIHDRGGIGQVLLGLGETHRSLGEYPKALEHFQKAHELYRDLGSRVWEAVAFYGMGGAHQGLGDYASALRSYREAQAIQSAIGDKLRESYTLCDLGALHLEFGKFSEAIDSLEQARQRIEAVGAKPEEIKCLAYESLAHLAQKEYAQALQVSQRASELLEHIERAKYARMVHFAHYKALRATGKSPEARPYLRRAHEELMQLAGAIEDPEIRELFLAVKSNREILEEIKQAR